MFSSRGSFTSPQAQKAQSLLEKYDVSSLDKTNSYVFEIIYPDNRIVVNYGHQEDLVYLATFNPDGTETFDATEMRQAGFPVARIIEGIDYRDFQSLNWDNAEGAVVKFSNGQRVKVKFNAYLELHRVCTNMSALTVWQWFKSSKALSDHLASIPDELFQWVQQLWKDFEGQYDRAYKNIKNKFDEIKGKDRRSFAKSIQHHTDKAILFQMLDDRHSKVRDAICDKFRPRGLPAPARYHEVVKKPGRLIVLCGISASGKTTWAESYVTMHADAVIVSRDALRLLHFGVNDANYYQSIRFGSREKFITEIQHTLIRRCLELSKTVVVDDTNLTADAMARLTSKFGGYSIEFVRFDINTEEAIARDQGRSRTVGAHVIREQQKKWQRLADSFDFGKQPPRELLIINIDTTFPKAFVFDIDGTLASNESGRSPYDWGRVAEDAVRPMVLDCLRALQREHKILICSGRDGCCEMATKKWLSDHSIPHDELTMRAPGDRRPDWMVKEEIWRKLARSYNLVAFFDDRQQVVDHGRALGLEMFQVAPGNF